MLPHAKISQVVCLKSYQLDVTTLNREFSMLIIFVFMRNLLLTTRSLYAFELTYECTRSEWYTCCTIEEPVFNLWQGQQIFLSFCVFAPELLPTHPPI
jgi:hypothetical protein